MSEFSRCAVFDSQGGGLATDVARGPHSGEMTQLADFIHEALARMFEEVRCRPCGRFLIVATAANRRLDVWIYRDENTALRAAAELAMSRGSDEDPVAVTHFR